MSIEFNWHVENVDKEIKDRFENMIQENIIKTLKIPKKYVDQNLIITIHKNPDEPRKSNFIAGKILTENNSFIAEYKLQYTPTQENYQVVSYKDTLQF